VTRPKEPKAPRALRVESCSDEAKRIAARIGISIIEVENLLRQGRTAAELLVLAERRKRR
jgi:hypothetical protein